MLFKDLEWKDVVSDDVTVCSHCEINLCGVIKMEFRINHEPKEDKVDECSCCGCPIEKSRGKKIISVKKGLRPHSNQRNRIIIPIVAVVVCVIIGIVIYGVKIVKPQNTYNEAVTLLETGKYEQANELFDTIQNYKDVPDIII